MCWQRNPEPCACWISTLPLRYIPIPKILFKIVLPHMWNNHKRRLFRKNGRGALSLLHSAAQSQGPLRAPEDPAHCLGFSLSPAVMSCVTAAAVPKPILIISGSPCHSGWVVGLPCHSKKKDSHRNGTSPDGGHMGDRKWARELPLLSCFPSLGRTVFDSADRVEQRVRNWWGHGRSDELSQELSWCS